MCVANVSDHAYYNSIEYKRDHAATLADSLYLIFFYHAALAHSAGMGDQKKVAAATLLLTLLTLLLILLTQGSETTQLNGGWVAGPSNGNEGAHIYI